MTGLDDRSRSRIGLLLGLILVLAALARFYGLDYHSLRNDELSSWARSNHETVAEVIEYGVKPDPHPPGFQVMLWAIERNVGDSAVEMRAPSAMAGVLVVLMTFLLGRRLFGDREAVTAGLIACFSAAVIYYSQDARAYVFLTLTSVTSSWFLWPLIRSMDDGDRASPGAIAGFILTSAIACYLHYFGVVLFATQVAYMGGVALLGRRWFHLWLSVLCFIGVALLYAPWWIGFYEDLTAREAPDWIVPPGRQFPLRYLHSALNQSTLLVGVCLALLVYIFVVEVGRMWAGRRTFSLFEETRRAEFFLAYWLLAPFVIAVVRSWTGEPVASIRNLIILLPALYLIMARALALLPQRAGFRNGATAAVLLLLVYGLLFGMRYYTTPQKHQFRDLAEYVIAHEDERPGAPVYAFTYQKSYYDYYFERLGGQSRVAAVAGTTADIARIEALLAAERPSAFWYLTGTRVPDPEFLEFLSSRYRLADELLLYGTSARYYERPATTP